MQTDVSGRYDNIDESKDDHCDGGQARLKTSLFARQMKVHFFRDA
jgi:hypothetical protein